MTRDNWYQLKFGNVLYVSRRSFFRENIRAVVEQLWRGCIKALGVKEIKVLISLGMYSLRYL